MDGEDYWSDCGGLWEHGREWETPKLGVQSTSGRKEVKVNVESGPGVEEAEGEPMWDEDEWMLEDVLGRMEEGLRWLDGEECEFSLDLIGFDWLGLVWFGLSGYVNKAFTK